MINSVSIALNMSISFFAFEDSMNTYYYKYKRNPSNQNALLFLRKHVSLFASTINCVGNALEINVLSSRIIELVTKVTETGLNSFLLIKKFDEEKAVIVISDVLCATRVFWEISRFSLQPQTIFHYDAYWQTLAILDIASRLLLLSIRKD